MAQAIVKDTTPLLSSLFADPYLRRVFERAERDTPPAALAVESPLVPELTDGAAVVRELVEA